MREVEDSTDIKRYFYKNNPADKIYWVSLFRESIDKDGKKSYEPVIGNYAVSFDKKNILYIFKDYPNGFSKEEKELFDKENPYWADFFKDRKYIRK